MSELDRQKLLEEILPHLEAIVWVTSPLRGNSPNRSRAIAGQIARNAIKELRSPKAVIDEIKENLA